MINSLQSKKLKLDKVQDLILSKDVCKEKSKVTLDSILNTKYRINHKQKYKLYSNKLKSKQRNK